jgi:hypothetical protein
MVAATALPMADLTVGERDDLSAGRWVEMTVPPMAVTTAGSTVALMADLSVARSVASKVPKTVDCLGRS